MALKLHKWFFILFACLLCSSFSTHPIYISLVEIEHNAKDKTLEISCKIFTDDFEKTLRAAYHTHVDLLDEAGKKAMNKLVSDYVEKHVRINVDGKAQLLQFKGYEQIEEGIYSYFQVDNVPLVKSITVTDNLLYEYQSQQIGLLYITVNGSRQSHKLTNPDEKASFTF